MGNHSYRISLCWTGDRGTGTSGYQAYGRDHEIVAEGKPTPIAGSSDPYFRGDASRYNPEELLVASLSACHMLSYLHLCAVNGVVVTSYGDEASGEMAETAGRGGHMTGVTLRPRVVISAESDPAKALALHDEAHHLCFIANSVNFPVGHEAVVTRAAGA
jgi:organic hydroperoxide reductase OsmC/OhrA